ncbi:MAG: FGGY-family carbohydrate kinase, partial [Candidatus Latescibacterota bacterium]|nr:FGGY-family carbohydrate kinase [Candidatus Latescibacterota bacterium]
LLMQFQADLLDVPVIRPRVAETTALGAAYAAGLAVGFWSNVDELRSNWSAHHGWNPSMDACVREAHIAQWKKAVERSLGWIDG